MDRIDERYQRGLALRQRMFKRGDNQPAPPSAIAQTKPEFTELLTEFVFGEIWNRPGLALRDRSLITIAALTVLGHQEELRLHLRAALNNGLTRDEITEAILHLGFYGGLPTAVTGFRVAREVFAEFGL
jgi:alkylhydroperoxidase/carboxymuconolactone decarboxylase family protein YurZ